MWRILVHGFGIRVRCHGEVAPPAGTLYAANHISWSDIAVLAALVDAGFVAKHEVSEWPVIGGLSRRYDCLFIERGRRGMAREQASAVHRHLGAGSGLILFPEGTTGEGAEVLPFRSSLFAVAEEAGLARVQPVTLIYRRRDGSALAPGERRKIAWMGEDALLPHAIALAASDGVIVDVHFEAIVATGNRKLVAEACRTAIAERLAGNLPHNCH